MTESSHRAFPVAPTLSVVKREVELLRRRGFDVTPLERRLEQAAHALGAGRNAQSEKISGEALILARAMRRIEFTSIAPSSDSDDPQPIDLIVDPSLPRAADLITRVRSQIRASAPVSPSPRHDTTTPARERLAEAERQLARGQTDDAERLAGEAGVLLHAARQLREVAEDTARKWANLMAAAPAPAADASGSSPAARAEGTAWGAERLSELQHLTDRVQLDAEDLERLGLNASIVIERTSDARRALVEGRFSDAELALREAIILARTLRQLRLIQTRRTGETVEARETLKAELARVVAKALAESVRAQVERTPVERAPPQPAVPVPTPAPISPAISEQLTEEVVRRARAEITVAEAPRVAEIENERDRLRAELDLALRNLSDISQALRE